MSGTIGPEDYMEPACVLCGEPFGAEPKTKTVPQQRIIQKMDEYMSRRDYAGAERHLLYWLEEAKLGRDLRGQLMLLNELVGHYRKVSDREHALARAEEALALLPELDMEDSVSGGTTYVNCATAMNAFGENERALALFEKARAAYEEKDDTDPKLLGGLYNNMALVYTALGRFAEAAGLYEKALSVMEKVPGGGLESAITYLNMANLAEAEAGLPAEGAQEDTQEDAAAYPKKAAQEDPAAYLKKAAALESRINELLTKAFELFDTTDAPRDGYYAFVCEKCAPTFSYYGWFLAAKELTRRAEELYAQN